MRAPTAAALAALALLGGVPASADQLPLQQEPSQPVGAAKIQRELTGRFMHVTDFHPDPFYKKAATLASGCHRLQGEDVSKKGRMKGKSRSCFDCIWDAISDPTGDERDGDEELSGEWGTPVSDCDSPMTLIDLTFNWLKKEWDEQVDFILWTGDSVRHDIDNLIPRSSKEIFDLNQMMADRMVATFGKKIPIIPSLGNNDVYPHNIMEPGPNRVTQEFLKIWKHFIPEEYRHVFERGGYFAVEVIPDQLAVISLNTIYYFESNAAVDGCKAGSGEPGDQEMEWLEVQLQQFRERGMQVHLIGHVAPHQGLYYDDCYLRYGDLALRYQDTIVGHHYGHQNIDHFFFMDVQELDAVSMGSAAVNGSLYLETEPQEEVVHPSVDDYSYPGPKIRGPHFLNSGRFKIFGRKKSALLKKELRKSWRSLPTISDLKYKDYAVINVAPSIIPTYQPAARIYSYNITGVSLDPSFQVPPERFVPDDPEDGTLKTMKGDCAKKKNWNKPHCSFRTRPRYASPDSPSRSNKALTVLGYTQFYLPELDTKSTVPPGWQIEYTTFRATSLLPDEFTAALGGTPYGQPPPVPFHLLPGFDPDIIDTVTGDDLAGLDGEDEDEEGEGAEANGHGRRSGNRQNFGISREEKKDEFLAAVKSITPWKHKDLTIKTYVKFARRLADDNKAFKKFLDFMFVSSCPGDTC